MGARPRFRVVGCGTGLRLEGTDAARDGRSPTRCGGARVRLRHGLVELFVRRDRNGEKIFEMYSETVEINKDLKDSLFTLPANVKMLPKAK